MTDQLNTMTALIIGVCTASALLAGAYKVLWYGKKDENGRRVPGSIKRFLLDLRGFRDAILGRDAIYDSITGAELAPTLPDIGMRMAAQEKQMAVLTEAVADIAKSNRRIDEIEERTRELFDRVITLEEQKVERVLGKAESIQLLHTMEAAIGGDSHDRPGKDTLP